MAFEGEGFYAGEMQVNAAGTLVLQIESPRAIRLWLAGTPVLDESLFWRHYERKLWAVATFPCTKGGLDFLVDRSMPPRPRARGAAFLPSASGFCRINSAKMA